MRVKIGSKWYDSVDQPICIQVSELEQSQIAGLDRGVALNGKYAIFPDSVAMSRDAMIEWMSDPQDTTAAGNKP